MIRGGNHMLEIKNLTIAYGKNSIVSGDISCSFGEVTALTGLSGSGKTTILKIIASLNKVGSYDKYAINNVVVSKMSPKQRKQYLAQNIFYIDQDSQLLQSMNCFDQLTLHQKLNPKKAKYTLAEILDIVQLPIDNHTKVSQLSNGERQRFMIALALARDASIILCDESTSSLDYENKENIFAILKELTHEWHKMVIVVSRDADIYEQCDCIYEITDKQIKLKTKKDTIEPVVPLKKTSATSSMFKHIMKSRFHHNKYPYLLTCLLTSFMVVLLIMGKQASTQYTRNVKVTQAALSKNQVFLTNYNLDHTVDTGYQTNNLPFENKMIQFVEESPYLEASYPLYCFNIGRFLNNDPEDPDSLNCIIDIISATQTITMPIPKDRTNDNIFSYYPEDNIENACDVYREDVDGIILNYLIAKQLGIKNSDEVSIKLTLYVPVAIENVPGTLTSAAGATYEREVADTTYLPYEITLPVKGILSRAHIDLAECFGYLDYQTMATIFAEKMSQYPLQDQQYPWSSNTYSLYMPKDQINDFYTDLLKQSNNYGLISLQKAAADMMSPWTDLEKPFKTYTMALALLTFIFIVTYGVIKNKAEKNDFALLSQWGVTKNDLNKLVLNEILLFFIIVTCLSLVDLFIGLQIGLSQNWIIKGFDYAKSIKEDYVIAVILSFILVLLSDLPRLISVRKISA